MVGVLLARVLDPEVVYDQAEGNVSRLMFPKAWRVGELEVTTWRDFS